jgi:hypothetical protein
LDIDGENFRNTLSDKFRSPHLWGKDQQGNWRLRHTVWNGGLDD